MSSLLKRHKKFLSFSPLWWWDFMTSIHALGSLPVGLAPARDSFCLRLGNIYLLCYTKPRAWCQADTVHVLWSWVWVTLHKSVGASSGSRSGRLQFATRGLYTSAHVRMLLFPSLDVMYSSICIPFPPPSSSRLPPSYICVSVCPEG